MKTGSIYSGIIIMLLVMFTFSPQGLVVAQDRNTIPASQDVKIPFTLPLHQPGIQKATAPRLSMNNLGKGLQYYDCILLQNSNKKFLSSKHDHVKSIIVKSAHDELELETFRQNMLFIDKECQTQIKEWMKKEKWDLHLGEVIKGFYQTSVF